MFILTTVQPMLAQQHLHSHSSNTILEKAHNNVGIYFPYIFQKGVAVFYERLLGDHTWSIVLNGIYSTKDNTYEVFPEVRYHFFKSPPKALSKVFLGSKEFSYDFHVGLLASYITNKTIVQNEFLFTAGGNVNLEKGWNVGAFGGIGPGFVTKNSPTYPIKESYIASKLPFYYISLGYRF